MSNDQVAIGCESFVTSAQWSMSRMWMSFSVSVRDWGMMLDGKSQVVSHSPNSHRFLQLRNAEPLNMTSSREYIIAFIPQSQQRMWIISPLRWKRKNSNSIITLDIGDIILMFNLNCQLYIYLFPMIFLSPNVATKSDGGRRIGVRHSNCDIWPHLLCACTLLHDGQEDQGQSQAERAHSLVGGSDRDQTQLPKDSHCRTRFGLQMQSPDQWKEWWIAKILCGAHTDKR